jgi:hypothetical protein
VPGDGGGGADNPESGSDGTPAAGHGCSLGGSAARTADGGSILLMAAFVGLVAFFRRNEKPLVSRYLT